MDTRHKAIVCLALLLALPGCDFGSESRYELASSNPDPWLDPQNVYRYLKSPAGDCLFPGAECSELAGASVTQFKTINGFNGIPYGVGDSNPIDVDADGVPDEVVKYSGNLATYTAKHSPSAVRRGRYTYFTYSGEVPLDGFESGRERIASAGAVGCRFESTRQFAAPGGSGPALGIFVARYNHVTGRVSRPVLVHAKCTNDPHDNAVINLDAAGHVYLLISGRSEYRGNFVFRSDEPLSIASFEDVTPAMDDYIGHFNDLAEAAGLGRLFIGTAFRGINYPKMFWIDQPGEPGGGYFRLVYTIYCGRNESITCMRSRQLYTARMDVEETGVRLRDIQPLAAFKGHYAVANARGLDVVVAFNLHPDNAIDDRTNLYFMHSVDGGETWLNAENEPVAVPIVDPGTLGSIAVREYYNAEHRGPVTHRVYVKDVDFTDSGLAKKATILFVGSHATDHRPSLTADHYLGKEHWTGSAWMRSRLTNAVDHNYSSGALVANGDSYRAFYPHTNELHNNALAGGSLAYVDTAAGHDATGSPVLLSDDEGNPLIPSATYLADLCEFNYVKAVLGGSADFAGLVAAGNPYQYRKAAPLFIVDLDGGLRRLPLAFSDADVVDDEVALEPTTSCLADWP